MGFWIFMLIMDLLVPLIMIGFGSYFSARAPKQINDIFGYRTTMSMKNKDTWEFAHHHNGKIFRAVGWALLVLTIGAMIFVFDKDTDTVGSLGAIVVGVQTAVLIGSIIPTEVALRKTFDEDGHRK